MKVYLAGAINGRSDEDCKDWRDYSSRCLSKAGIESFDPMVRDYRGRELEAGIAAKIVEQDKKDIDEATHLLVYYDKPSVGTSMEVLYANERGKPVVLVDRSERPLSPWLAYHASVVFKSLDDAIAHMSMFS